MRGTGAKAAVPRIAEGLCTWSLFVQDYHAVVGEFQHEKKIGQVSLHRGYMQRLERLAEEALAAGQAREVLLTTSASGLKWGDIRAGVGNEFAPGQTVTIDYMMTKRAGTH